MTNSSPFGHGRKFDPPKAAGTWPMPSVKEWQQRREAEIAKNEARLAAEAAKNVAANAARKAAKMAAREEFNKISFSFGEDTELVQELLNQLRATGETVDSRIDANGAWVRVSAAGEVSCKRSAYNSPEGWVMGEGTSAFRLHDAVKLFVAELQKFLPIAQHHQVSRSIQVFSASQMIHVAVKGDSVPLKNRHF